MRTSSPESSRSAAAGWSATCSASGGGQVGAHAGCDVAGHASRTIARRRATSMRRQHSPGSTSRPSARHFFFVPALPELVDPWFRLSFGASAALAMRETAPEAPVDGRRRRSAQSTPDDFGHAARSTAMGESMAPAHRASPSTRAGRRGHPRRGVGRYLGAAGNLPPFVAERDGQIVGHILLYRRPHDLRVPATRSTSPRPRPGRGAGDGRRRRAHPPRARLGVRAGLPDHDRRTGG